MKLDINKEKFEIFLEVAKELNKSFNIVLILYGSLGLSRVIGEFGEVNDIDVLVPERFIKEGWDELNSFMQSLGFKLKDEHEHEFIKNGKIIAFGKEKDLSELAKIDPDNLKISEVEGTRFKELSPEQYLSAYQSMLRDEYRQEKRGTADKEKIKLIKEYIEKNKE